MEPPVKSADRVLQIVELLTATPTGLSFTDIRLALGLPKSSAYSLLATMVSGGFLAIDPTSRLYTVGLRLWQAGQAYLAVTDLERAALPHLQAIRDSLNETVQLAVLDGLENVYIAKVDADQQLTLASRVGSRLPAYATGIGKVLLSGLTDEEIRDRFAGHAFVQFTDQTVTGIDALLAAVSLARVEGLATDMAEYTAGVCCVAMPVRDNRSTIRAAISVSVPQVRMSTDLRRDIERILRVETDQLSSRLGYRGRSAGSVPAMAIGTVRV